MDSPAVALREQGVLRFWQFCVLTIVRLDGEHTWLFCRVGCICAKFVPVVAVVADEVGDLAEGLVHDGVLEGHGCV